ncbi:MAG TPA: (d)CMP kinase [Streptosporangiaceae bacterium]|nr:(d)CMP kinase [Streptosporangiaceae bacterium]
MTGCLVIAVDGPAGSGKSSTARGVAAELGLRYLDTGAMYRALTWWMISQKLDLSDPQSVAACARRPVIQVTTDPVSPAVTVDGTDVTRLIRTREVSNAVSAVASVPEVRAHLVARQQAILASACAAGEGIVAEGRDIGTVVAPQAVVKVFLTASEAARAVRRSADLAADPGATPAVTQDEQRRRDKADAAQSAMASDAIEVDSTVLSLDQVIGLIVRVAGERGFPLAGRPARTG